MRLQSIGGRIAMPEVSQDVQQPFRSAQPTTPMPQDDLAGALLAAQQHAQVPQGSFQSAFLGPVAEFYHNKRQNALDEKAVMAQNQAAQAQAMQQADAVYKAFRQAGADDNTARAYAQGVMTGKLDADKVFAELTKDKSFTLGAGAERRAADGSLIAANERDAATTKIDLGDKGPQIGSIPQGWEVFKTPEGGYSMRPIKGGPAEREIEEDRAGEVESRRRDRYKTDSVLKQVNRALENVGPSTSGVLGAAMRQVPGTPATDFEATIKSVLANLSFDQLRAMRTDPANKTGGALGNVTERELDLLQSVISGYDPNASEGFKRQFLQDVQTHYGNYLKALDGEMPEGYDEQGNPIGAQGGSRQATERKTVNGKSYVKVDGQWYEE